MSILFDRSWALRISPPLGGKGLLFDSDYSQGEPLRFTFAVDRTLHSDSNKAEFVLSNLSPAHRQLIGLGSVVQLRAGYGKSPGIVFLGHVAEIQTQQDGPNVNTALRCGDGEPYLQSGFVSLTYNSTTTLARVLRDICQALSIDINGQVFAYKGHVVQRVPRITLPRRVLSGPVKKVLDELLHPLQIQWSIQCGTLLIQYNQGVVSLRSTVLSYATGLVGVPTMNKSGVGCTALIQSTIAPGLAVTIQGSAKECNGTFRVVTAKYSGDTGGKDWTVEIGGEALTYPLADLAKPTSQQGFEAAQADVSGLEDGVDEAAVE